MKNNSGITVATMGLILTMLGPTLFEENKFLKYSFLVLGVLLALFSVYKADKERKLK